jgi:predicted lipoprotein
MKISPFVTFLLLPLLANAQMPPQFDQQQIQAMMQNAQKMQTCIQNVDQSQMQAFEQKGKQMEQQVDALCAAGHRDEALAKAMSFSQEISSDPAIIELKKCQEMMQGIMPGISKFAEDYADEDSDGGHICDD